MKTPFDYYFFENSCTIKTQYSGPLYIKGCHIVLLFRGCACLNVSHLKLLKKIHNIFAYNIKIQPKQNIEIKPFNKVGDYSIFVKTNVAYLCTQKHKYITKII
jgi:hypothetical protein